MARKIQENIFIENDKHIKIPKYHGRIMKEIKKYPNFILFEDQKTKIKMCFFYEELGREDEKGLIKNGI